VRAGPLLKSGNFIATGLPFSETATRIDNKLEPFMPNLKLKMVVAATNANGEPDLFFCKVICSKEQYEEGDHYDAAKDQAKLEGYESEMVAFDENDPPKSLFELFVWNSAEVVDISDELISEVGE
jgi:hypothetical protein